MKNEQEKLEEFLKSELKKEGDAIRAEVEADESLKNITLPDDFDDGLWEKIKKREEEKAAYEALSEKDKEALRLGREMMLLQVDEYADERDAEDEDVRGKNRVKIAGSETGAEEEKDTGDKGKVVRYRKRKKRIYLLVAAVAVMVLAIGMTSIGGAPFVAKIRKQLVGEREMVKVNSEREGEDERLGAESEESKFYQNIRDTFGFEPAMLVYLPSNTSVIDYEINQELKEACMLLECNGEILEYQVFMNFINKSVGYSIEDELIEEKSVVVSNTKIDIKCYEIKASQIIEYVAQFEKENVFYVINGCIEKEEFEEIINNLKIL